MSIVKVRHKESGREYAVREAWIDDAEEVKVGEIDACDAEEIGHCLDEDAENENYHGLCGAGGALARLCTQHAGPEAARAIMAEIAGAGGIMNFR